MLFISPPFGNYISLPNTTPIHGSFTLQPRPGLFSQIMKTLRYSTKYSGWVNKIGLRNPGLDVALDRYSSRNIISIAILSREEIKSIVRKIPIDQNIELNVSCPNTEKATICEGLEVFVNPEREWCIIKLAPTTTLGEVDGFYGQGFRQFHCSNTLPRPEGAVSGPLLRPKVFSLLRMVREAYPDVTLIGGGGVRSIEDAEEYLKAGADHISVSTLCFNPVRFAWFYWNWRNKGV